MAKVGRKSKYSEELAKIMCDAISHDGRDEAGWKAGAISCDTFYSWKRQFPQFLEGIRIARNDYQKSLPDSTKRLAKTRLLDVLTNGLVIHRRKCTSVVKEQRNHNGEIDWTQTHTESTENFDNVGVPQWVFDRILPREDVNQAIQIIERFGLKVVAGDNVAIFNEWINSQIEQADNTEQLKPGISEDFANEIRRKILGIPSDASSIAQISAEVDDYVEETSSNDLGEVPTDRGYLG